MANKLFHDYDAFVERFVPKKTTDDCYTPQPVYDAILRYVGKLTPLEGREVVRPFWPGGDYKSQDYPENCIVVDNPPFSILTEIIRFYCKRGISFFLFAPSLTLFTARDCDVTYVVTGCTITYENGAKVRTGFIHNLPCDLRIDCSVELTKEINDAQNEPNKSKRGFIYPDNLVTSAILQKLVAHSTPLQIRKADCVAITSIDSAKGGRSRDIFGGGFLLSERAAAERAAAERAAAERAAAERIQLSVRERRLIKSLNAQKP